MPDVFGLKQLTFWQALRILILASILFGGHRALTTTVPIETQSSPVLAQ